MEPNEYKCEKCGGIFEKGWSDEEAAIEYIAIYGEAPMANVALLCEDCYQKYHKWFEKERIKLNN